ncbi:MAG TPA: hypothetical protein VGN26_19170 [Armatimonadota bacterium]|jgi:hypothetical protein
MTEGLGLLVALVLALAVGGDAAAQGPAQSELSAWKATAGKWKAVAKGISGEGFLDNRLVLQAETPETFEWSVELSLKEGCSAGVLLYASEDGARGYSVRLDSRLGELILSRFGPWPEETRLSSFPWGVLDGATVKLRILAGGGTVRAFVPSRGAYPLLEARKLELAGRHVGLRVIDAQATFVPGPAKATSLQIVTAHVPQVGAFTHIYDPSVGRGEPWYINDHCFIQGSDGWHLFGITHAKPAAPMEEKSFAHATSPDMLKTPWAQQPDALTFDKALGEAHLWAPHVIKRGDAYYMFYCAGSQKGNYFYRIHLATSKDLRTWTRYPDNPLFQDFFDARDPMVLEVDGTYYLYYTANLDRERMNHVVKVRTSKDLLHWSPARVALTHPETGTFGGPTESPFVVRYGRHFYLFCGPDGAYHRTVVYRSPNPYHWEYSQQIYSFPSHAAEVVETKDGHFYASDSGWDMAGVYLAPLEWKPEE